ncbi:MAG: hypothetical protein DMG06_30945 [Acidobacteria bacterium]|nr:MAG: hypothetical protein DMG06_30945 [Acidobacteriota bacterium]
MGLSSAIAFDMGGTTAKASFIRGGEVSLSAELEEPHGGDDLQYVPRRRLRFRGNHVSSLGGPAIFGPVV